MEVLSVDQLYKSFGKTKAVNGLSFQVNKGDVYGILGPNGSGKTTTLSILLDIERASSGHYQWTIGEYIASIRQKIGVLIERPNFYPYLNALDNLKIVADIKQTGYEGLGQLLTFVGLEASQKRRFDTFSLGMKQRLAVAGCLVGDPEVVIFDEPTNGLDAEGIAIVRDLITKIAAQGTTILLASHLLDEIQKVCTRILIINKGTKVVEGRLSDLLQSSEESLEKLYLRAISNE